mgnify:FL=1
MDGFLLGGLIVLFTAVLPCLIFGYLIAFQGRRNLISGWCDSKISNPESGGRIIGISLMVMAVLLSFVTLLWFLQHITEIELVYYLMPASLLPVVALLYVKNKYGVK